MGKTRCSDTSESAGGTWMRQRWVRINMSFPKATLHSATWSHWIAFVVLVLTHGSNITIPAAFDGSRTVAQRNVLAALAAQAVLRRLGIVAVEAEQRRIRRHQDGSEAGGRCRGEIGQLCEKMTEWRIAEQTGGRLGQHECPVG